MSDEFLRFSFLIFLAFLILPYLLLYLPLYHTVPFFLLTSCLSLYLSPFILLHGHTKPRQGSTAGYGRKLLAAKEAQVWLPGSCCQLPALGHASPTSPSPRDTLRGEQRTSDAHLYSTVCGEARLAPLAAASGPLECSLWLCGDQSPGHPVCGSAAHYNCLWVSGAREAEPREEIVERRAARLNLIRATWSSKSRLLHLSSLRPHQCKAWLFFLHPEVLYKNMSLVLPWHWQHNACFQLWSYSPSSVSHWQLESRGKINIYTGFFNNI